MSEQVADRTAGGPAGGRPIAAAAADAGPLPARPADTPPSHAGPATARPADSLPSALDPIRGVPALVARSGGRPLLVFLDFDGTLSPIVERPERALISREMRESVRRLARHATVTVLSGRDLRDVRARVGLPGVWYAGSHGLEIEAPRAPGAALALGRRLLPDLDRAEAALREALAGIPGSEVERKRFAIAVHFRRVAPQDRDRAESEFERAAERFPTLRTTSGKEVRELLPDIRWDKGTAVEWMVRRAGGAAATDPLPLVIGDDVTDEDAFRAVRGSGAAVVVGAGPRTTLATHSLEGTREVRELLRELALLARRGRRDGRPSLPAPAGAARRDRREGVP